MVSIIIPTLNEALVVDATLAAVAGLVGPREVIVIDGGSTDATVARAAARGARVVPSPPGRGVQLAAGAAAATGDVLWFVHADTLVPADALQQIGQALAAPEVVAGNFRLRFLGESPGARFLEFLYPRLSWIGLRYGDSGFFVRRCAYRHCGGFRPLPLFEDLDLLRRVRRQGRWRTLAGPLVTSGRRFEGRPFAPVFAHWVWLQVLYWLGHDPEQLARRYYPARGARAAGDALEP